MSFVFNYLRRVSSKIFDLWGKEDNLPKFTNDNQNESFFLDRDESDLEIDFIISEDSEYIAAGTEDHDELTETKDASINRDVRLVVDNMDDVYSENEQDEHCAILENLEYATLGSGGKNEVVETFTGNPKVLNENEDKLKDCVKAPLGNEEARDASKSMEELMLEINDSLSKSMEYTKGAKEKQRPSTDDDQNEFFFMDSDENDLEIDNIISEDASIKRDVRLVVENMLLEIEILDNVYSRNKQDGHCPNQHFLTNLEYEKPGRNKVVETSTRNPNEDKIKGSVKVALGKEERNVEELLLEINESLSKSIECINVSKKRSLNICTSKRRQSNDNNLTITSLRKETGDIDHCELEKMFDVKGGIHVFDNGYTDFEKFERIKSVLPNQDSFKIFGTPSDAVTETCKGNETSQQRQASENKYSMTFGSESPYSHQEMLGKPDSFTNHYPISPHKITKNNFVIPNFQNFVEKGSGINENSPDLGNTNDSSINSYNTIQPEKLSYYSDDLRKPAVQCNGEEQKPLVMQCKCVKKHKKDCTFEAKLEMELNKNLKSLLDLSGIPNVQRGNGSQQIVNEEYSNDKYVDSRSLAAKWLSDLTDTSCDAKMTNCDDHTNMGIITDWEREVESETISEDKCTGIINSIKSTCISAPKRPENKSIVCEMGTHDPAKNHTSDISEEREVLCIINELQKLTENVQRPKIGKPINAHTKDTFLNNYEGYRAVDEPELEAGISTELFEIQQTLKSFPRSPKNRIHHDLSLLSHSQEIPHINSNETVFKLIDSRDKTDKELDALTDTIHTVVKTSEADTDPTEKLYSSLRFSKHNIRQNPPKRKLEKPKSDMADFQNVKKRIMERSSRINAPKSKHISIYTFAVDRNESDDGFGKCSEKQIVENSKRKATPERDLKSYNLRSKASLESVLSSDYHSKGKYPPSTYTYRTRSQRKRPLGMGDSRFRIEDVQKHAIQSSFDHNNKFGHNFRNRVMRGAPGKMFSLSEREQTPREINSRNSPSLTPSKRFARSELLNSMITKEQNIEKVTPLSLRPDRKQSFREQFNTKFPCLKRRENQSLFHNINVRKEPMILK